jgi:phosphoglucomutase
MKSCQLTFGTAGIRAVMGKEENELNASTIKLITNALICALQQEYAAGSIAIFYDSRNNAKKFASFAAELLCEHGFDVFTSDQCEPTPFLSYVIRQLDCIAGINITASHNTKEYNGYKVYNAFGAQINTQFAQKVQYYLHSGSDAAPSLHKGQIKAIPDYLYGNYINAILNSTSDIITDFSNISVIYTPLFGAGFYLAPALFEKAGITVQYAARQMEPNGNFPSIEKPNPEEAAAFSDALALTESFPADILLATDPDADRLGIMVLHQGKYELFSGNTTGLVLLYFLLSTLKENNMDLSRKYVVKSIVSTSLADSVCAHYGVKLVNVPVGFRYIGEQIELDDKNYLFGFEESCGYLKGTHARDKDGIEAAYLVIKAAAYYKNKGKSLVDITNEIYEKFGYICDYNKTISMPVDITVKKMNRLRKNPPGSVLGENAQFIDLQNRNDTLKSNVVLLKTPRLQIILRPSGTEPKLKIYISSNSISMQKAQQIAKDAYAYILQLFN